MHLSRVFALVAGLALTGAGAAQAQETCGGEYRVKSGDSLSLIADRLYKDYQKWTVIFRSNADKISSPDSIRVGQVYRVPCIDGLPRGLAGGTPITDSPSATNPVARSASITPQSLLSVSGTVVTESQAALERRARQRGQEKVRLLVGDDYRPFTNRLMLSSGLISDLANRAMVAGEGNADHEFVWINDRAAHLDPVLSSGMVDIALPWKKPDCQRFATSAFCTDYLYSDAVFEMLVVAFEAKARPVRFDTAQDLVGKRVCSPLGHHTGQAGNGAALLSQVGARMMLPETAEDCFQRLSRGEADLVVMNEFSGRLAVKEQGLDDQIDIILRKPISIEGLHAVVHRSNPRAEEVLATFNEGLKRMQENGEYLQVIDKHLSSIWAGL